MKKFVSIRALFITLLLIFTLAIPMLVSADTPAKPAEIVQAELVKETAPQNPDSIIVQSPNVTYVEDTELVTNEAIEPAENVSQPTTDDETSVSLDSASFALPTTPSYCDYCGSADHSYTYCALRSMNNEAIGRWVIPSVGINVACYSLLDLPQWALNDPNRNCFDVINDAQDAAVVGVQYGDLWSIDFIGDHSNQAFSVLKYVQVGDEAYMDYGTCQQKYVCTKVEYGHNNGTLCDSNWAPLTSYDFNDGGYTCYTCNGCWQNIFIAAFQPVYD